MVTILIADVLSICDQPAESLEERSLLTTGCSNDTVIELFEAIFNDHDRVWEYLTNVVLLLNISENLEAEMIKGLPWEPSNQTERGSTGIFSQASLTFLSARIRPNQHFLI